MNSKTHNCKIINKSSKLLISFAEYGYQCESKAVDVVVDMDLYGEIIAVEIIGLKSSLASDSEHLFCSIDACKNISYSYDNDVDALYIKLRKERSLDQKELSSNIYIGNNGDIAFIEIELEND